MLDFRLYLTLVCLRIHGHLAMPSFIVDGTMNLAGHLNTRTTKFSGRGSRLVWAAQEISSWTSTTAEASLFLHELYRRLPCPCHGRDFVSFLSSFIDAHLALGPALGLGLPSSPLREATEPDLRCCTRTRPGLRDALGHGRSAGQALLDMESFEATLALRGGPPLAGASGRHGSGCHRPAGSSWFSASGSSSCS